MTGKVDDYGRPLLPVAVRNVPSGSDLTLEAWVDTAFTGALMLLPDQIASLGMTPTSVAKVLLADGSEIEFPKFEASVDWFGSLRDIEILAGTGKFALVGLRLLEDCRLLVDYLARTVELTLVASSS